MMNPRVLELLKHPKNIRSEDLNLLKEEINSFPYIQNIRALHLYGVHLYNKENYQKELSVTAAYTTDKKILYQLINGKIQQKPKSGVVEEKQEAIENIIEPVQESEKISEQREENLGKEEKPLDKKFYETAASSLITPKPEIKHIYINGERNRILFEGEENFFDESSTEIIDIESTLESGFIVTQKLEKIDQRPDQRENAELAEILNETEEISDEEGVSEFTPVTIIEEEISSPEIKETVNNDAGLSFHQTESFMPEVNIQAGNSDKILQKETYQTNIYKHEDEMKRLIEEVEKKMKENKKTSSQLKDEVPETISRDINFAETQSFHVESKETETEGQQQDSAEEELESPGKAGEPLEKKEELFGEIQQEVKSTWKPMNFETSVPDSLINKPDITSDSKPKTSIKETPKQEDTLPVIKEIPTLVEDKHEEIETGDELKEDRNNTAFTKENQEEVPVINVSFFGSDISSLKINEPKKEETQETSTENESSKPGDSNVPGFINTWKNWLKIDRTQETEEAKVMNKLKVIDSFIENNPKITQLKEDSNFIVKEKADDISHLMTETLANLYFEQKLYTKAVKAFQILAEKYPGKKEYFEGKIQEIKDIRGKN